MVEKSYLGGICLNWGCIPTKALLRSAEIFHYMEHAKDYGLSAKDVAFDGAAVVKRSRGVAAQLSNGVAFLLKKNKVDVIWGTATLTAPGKLAVKAADNPPKGALGAGDYAAKHIIVATGARPRALPGHRAGPEAGLDLFRGDGSGPRSRNRCSSSARARSASSSPRSTGRWAPT